MQGRGNGCAGTTLGARDDFKRHFVISAGLQAATASDTAFGMGELKELLDSNEGGSGFSFRDMVADAAGVRFARALLAAPPEEWKPMLARLDGEDAILPAFEDLPEHLTEAEFRARFGDVDSAAYAAMVAEIDARVAALPFYAPADTPSAIPRRPSGFHTALKPGEQVVFGQQAENKQRNNARTCAPSFAATAASAPSTAPRPTASRRDVAAPAARRRGARCPPPPPPVSRRAPRAMPA